MRLAEKENKMKKVKLNKVKIHRSEEKTRITKKKGQVGNQICNLKFK